MTIRPIDRRGLQETVGFSTGVIALGIVLIVKLAITKQLDDTLLGIFGGSATALIARGTRGATERGSDSIGERGLSETISWVTAIAMMSAVIIAKLIIKHEPDGTLMGVLGGSMAALITRTAQGVSEKSAIAEIKAKTPLPPPLTPPPIPLEINEETIVDTKVFKP